MSKIKGKIWGFQKKEVDDHFNRLLKAHEAELEDLTRTIEKFQIENEILRQDVSNLTEKNISLPEGMLLELALKRVERVAGYIDQDVDIEVLAIDKITSQNSLLLDNTITEIDKDIELKKEIIEKELNNIVEIARGKEKTKNINIEVLKSIAKVLPIAEWLKNNKEEQPNLVNRFLGEEPISREQEQVEQMTSDGTTLESTQMPDTTKVVSADLNSNLTDITSDDKVPEIVFNACRQENEENIENVETKDNRNSVVESGLKDSQENVADANREEKTNPSIQDVVDTADSGNQTKTVPNGQLQADVREEISTVNNRNIIGRVAGEDIKDSSGQVIIRKDEPITLNIMQRAQNAGNLAELIIHMALPGQEK